ncbi:hypothetical protein RhiirA4_489727 [Rhizophagus irregularis]|uniref:Uncharacterized protein n=1 Tax=Rhizophagus irregularis TaxID=588596 RepID=A0A2I1HV26_9GLOM|nr:hypothetical protein RhiirA4_489727 [Rhizophagus irregularis]
MSNMGDSVGIIPFDSEDFLNSAFSRYVWRVSQPEQLRSTALYASSRSWDFFATCAYTRFGDIGDSESECPSAEDEFGSTYISMPKTTPKPVLATPPILPDVGGV